MNSESDRMIYRLFEERPTIRKLLVGYHLRNVQELDDVRKLLNFIDYHPQYVGLAGSRQVGKVYFGEDKLKKQFPALEHVVSYQKLAAVLPKHLNTIRATSDLRIPEFSELDALSFKAEDFLYDIDLVIAPSKLGGSGWTTHEGALSGTSIQIFEISQSQLHAQDGIFYDTFLNSQRILSL